MALDALRDHYLALTQEALPARAASEPGWPVRFDHCFMRIALDHAVGQRWTDVVAKPAYKHLTEPQLRRAIDAAERMLAEGPETAHALNRASLDARGKRGQASGAVPPRPLDPNPNRPVRPVPLA